MTDCLVRCACYEIRMMTTAEMRDHMAKAHPVLFEGLGLADERLGFAHG